jgi:hypothetical protein
MWQGIYTAYGSQRLFSTEKVMGDVRAEIAYLELQEVVDFFLE